MRDRCAFLALVFLSAVASPAAAARFLVTAADAGGGPHVIIRADTDLNGTFETVTDSFYAFGPVSPLSPLFAGGVRVATGDIDGDGNYELVTAMGPGGSLVRTWRLTAGGRVESMIEEFAPFGTFGGGIYVTMGDFDNDGRDDLITSADAGGEPLVVAWRDNDLDLKYADDAPLAGFFPYVRAFRGGVRVAAADVNGGGAGDELVTAPGPGGGPHVRVFAFTGSGFTATEEFFAYAPAFSGGVFVAAGAITNAGGAGAEIITAPGTGGGPHVRIFTDLDNDGRVSDDPTFDEFLAYTPAFTGGVHVAAGDSDGAGGIEVITTPGPGGGPHVRIYDDNDDGGSLLSDNVNDDQRFAFDPAFAGGVFTAVAQFASSAWAAPLGTGKAIPDAGSTYQFLCLPYGSGIVRNLQVGLTIHHSNNADLHVALHHLPSGRSAVLFTKVGGDRDGMSVRLADGFIDIGLAPLPTIGPLFGSFGPEAPAALAAFNGVDSSGCWLLTMFDDKTTDVGELVEWTMYFVH